MHQAVIPNATQEKPRFERDALTGLLPGAILRTPHGVGLLNMMLPDEDGVLLTFLDFNGFSLLERAGFEKTADLILATTVPELDSTVGVRRAGDELVIFAPYKSGRGVTDLNSVIDALLNSGRQTLQIDLSFNNDQRKQLLLSMGAGKFPDEELIRNFDAKLDAFVHFRMQQTQALTDWKSGIRNLRQNYLEQSAQTGVPIKLEDFSKFLIQKGALANQDVGAAIIHALEANPEMVAGPIAGSFDHSTIFIPKPVTLEKIQAALVQAEKFVHQIKKVPNDLERRSQLASVTELDTKSQLRTADMQEVELAAINAAIIENLRKELLSETHSDKRASLKRQLFLSEFSDPAINNVLRASRVEFEKIERLFNQSEITPVKIDLQGFAPLNNALGYSRADEILRNLIDSALNKLEEEDVLVRTSGGTLILLTSNFESSKLASLQAALESNLQQLYFEIPEQAKVKIELEFAERQALAQVIAQLNGKIEAETNKLFSEYGSAIVDQIHEFSDFSGEMALHPKIEVTVLNSVSPAQTTFGQLARL